jgi:uncharacterized protein (TIGR02147 family)
MVELERKDLPRPDILRYKDYRQFLGDYYNYKKALRSGFSFRRFSQMVGISSPNYLQLVIRKKRNLSDELAEQVARALGLEGAERRYFTALVCVENAKTEEAQQQAQSELYRSVRDLVSREIPKAKLSVLTEWYHLLVRELVVLPDFQPTGEWISKKMRGFISESDAEKSLAYLLKSGFLKNENSEWKQSDPVLNTGNALDEVIGLKYHSNTLSAWSENLKNTMKSQRELGVLNIPIEAAKIPELKQRIQRFQNEIVGWLQDEKNPEQLVQLGIYLIPVTN